MYDRKKFRSAQNVTDVSFFVLEGIVDSHGINLGFKGLDAQAVFPLSTSEG